MTPLSLRHPAVDAALATAATLLGMEVVFIGGLDESSFRFARVLGDAWPGLEEGRSTDRTDSLCHHMLSGAPAATTDAPGDPAYAAARVGRELGVRSYVGVPIRTADGTVVGTLCGIDRGEVVVDEARLGVLRELANIVAAHLPAGGAEVVIRRTPAGWAVGDGGGGEDGADDLVTAMVLADLLQEDLDPGGRPPRLDAADELSRLRLAVAQLEHALAARVTVEQAIGVLSERQQVTPREAFERLRRVARRSGLRVHALSRDVVASATSPRIGLPPELRAPRDGA